MQNGAFPWVTPTQLAAASISSSQKASQVSWPGYQASLTDLFFKKTPLHQFATSGISQLAAASSYWEKMTSLTSGANAVPQNSVNCSISSPVQLVNSSSSGGSPGDVLTNNHNNSISNSTSPSASSTTSNQKCQHPDSKDKPYPCEICQSYSSICASAPPSSEPSSDNNNHNSTNNCSSRMSANEHHDHKSGHHLSMSSPHLHHPQPAHLPPHHSGLPHHHQHHQHHHPHRRASTPGSSSPGMSRPRNSQNKQFLCPVCHKLFTQKGKLANKKKSYLKRKSLLVIILVDLLLSQLLL